MKDVKSRCDIEATRQVLTGCLRPIFISLIHNDTTLTMESILKSSWRMALIVLPVIV